MVQHQQFQQDCFHKYLYKNKILKNIIESETLVHHSLKITRPLHNPFKKLSIISSNS